MNKLLALSVLTFCTLISCTENNEKVQLTDSGLNPEKFKTIVDGKETGLYRLKNKNDMEVCITNFGGRIVSIMVPDKQGNMRDVVLGFDSIKDYIDNPSDYGASIGRYANRINNGKFTLDGVQYQLPKNNYGHCLHGGFKGFQYVVYDVIKASDNEIKLSYLAKDMEEGFPGNTNCTVTMTLTDDNAIKLSYEAETDKPTIINMTNHSYFNLDGNPEKGNSDYLLMVNASYYTPVDSTFMTTGEILPVENTEFDFRIPTRLGDQLSKNSEQLRNGHGIDHNWVLDTKGNINVACASLESKESGIKLEVFTDEPGIQVYTGNFLDGTQTGKKGFKYNFRASVCLETQKYPDTPNKPEWPSCILRPGEKYVSNTIFKFTTNQ